QRVIPLFGEARIVSRPVLFRLQLRRHSAAQTFPYWWPIPRALSDELLHGLNVSIGQTRRHRFNRLALAVQQQAAHVNGAPMPPLATTNRLQQINQKSFQTFMALSDLSLGHARDYHGSKHRL